jgi:hypothetical protein
MRKGISVGMPRRTYRGRSLRTSAERLTQAGGRISREDAKARRKGRRRFSVGDNVSQAPQLPKTLCGNEGVLECSGWTELGMGIERADGENPKRGPATAVQETRIRPEFFENDHLRGLAWDCGSFERERGSRGQASGACSVGTTPSARTVGWLSYLRDTPTVGIEDEQMAAEVRT